MKKILLILFAVALQSWMPASDNNVKTTKKLFELFNKHDWEAMAKLYADPATFLDPSFGIKEVSKTRAETVAKYKGMQETFPDLHDEVVAIYPSGDNITVEFVATGTAPDGTKFTMPIITVFTFKDGLIVRDATYYDNP